MYDLLAELAREEMTEAATAAYNRNNLGLTFDQFLANYAEGWNKVRAESGQEPVTLTGPQLDDRAEWQAAVANGFSFS